MVLYNTIIAAELESNLKYRPLLDEEYITSEFREMLKGYNDTQQHKTDSTAKKKKGLKRRATVSHFQ